VEGGSRIFPERYYPINRLGGHILRKKFGYTPAATIWPGLGLPSPTAALRGVGTRGDSFARYRLAVRRILNEVANK